MRPINPTDLLPITGRGHRYPTTIYATLTIKRLAMVAAREYFPGLSKLEQADRLRAVLLRYQAGAFRRSTGPACEARHRGRVEEVCHRILTLRDRVPSARSIRRWL
jgi:hypothetical protein